MEVDGATQQQARASAEDALAQADQAAERAKASVAAAEARRQQAITAVLPETRMNIRYSTFPPCPAHRVRTRGTALSVFRYDASRKYDSSSTALGAVFAGTVEDPLMIH